jgi:hypothetical protein
MSAKSLALLSATALLAVASATTAHAQGWRNDDGYGYRPRCLSSYGINESLARRGLYPLANVGGDPYGRYIYMRVARGNEQFVVTVDGCTGQVMR